MRTFKMALVLVLGVVLVQGCQIGFSQEDLKQAECMRELPQHLDAQIKWEMCSNGN